MYRSSTGKLGRYINKSDWLRGQSAGPLIWGVAGLLAVIDPEGEYAAPVRLCMIDGTKQAKICKFSWAPLKHIIRGVSKS